MRKRQALLLCALAGLGAGRLQAAQAPVDADLLEFLGSIGEDDDWQDYLEQKPVKAAPGKAVAEGKTTKVAQKVPEKAPDASRAPASAKEKNK